MIPSLVLAALAGQAPASTPPQELVVWARVPSRAEAERELDSYARVTESLAEALAPTVRGNPLVLESKATDGKSPSLWLVVVGICQEPDDSLRLLQAIRPTVRAEQVPWSRRELAGCPHLADGWSGPRAAKAQTADGTLTGALVALEEVDPDGREAPRTSWRAVLSLWGKDGRLVAQRVETSASHASVVAKLASSGDALSWQEDYIDLPCDADGEHPWRRHQRTVTARAQDGAVAVSAREIIAGTGRCP